MIRNLAEHAARSVRGKSILITGGAGTIGSALVRRLCDYDVKVIRALDNNEERAFYLKMTYRKEPRVRVLMGDIRDRRRMARAMQGVDYVLHLAALKHVELGEYNPFEVVSSNLTALQSLIEIALDSNVERFIFTSSDKAVNPSNVMGGSKFIGERLVMAANGYRGSSRTLFASTRFGNVLGSAGSVVPVFEGQLAQGGPLTVTEPEMTRFFMTLDEAVDLVLTALVTTLGGEVFVPKMHAVKLIDLAETMIDVYGNGKPVRIECTGLRPGEKLYEELITINEQPRCLETERLLIVLPYIEDWTIDSHGPAHKPGPEDYPDEPQWNRALYSSQTAVPLTRTAVRRLLDRHQQATAALALVPGRVS